MVRKAALAGLILIFSTAANAGDVAGERLWQDIEPGDSPAVVAQKIAAVPGVKKATPKARGTDGPLVDVKYEDGAGIRILSDSFKVVPLFVASKASQVGLVTEPTCINTLPDRFAGFLDLLADKYGEPVAAPDGGKAFASAIANAEPEAPTQVSTLFANDQTAVALVVQFSRVAAPPSMGMPGQAARSIGNLLWNNYLKAGAECAGTGLVRARIMISYHAKSDFDRIARTVKEEAEDKRAESAEKL